MSMIDPHDVTRHVCYSDEEDGSTQAFSLPLGTNIPDKLQDPDTGYILHRYTESEPCANISNPASLSLAQNVLTMEQLFSNPVGGNPFPNASPVTPACSVVPLYDCAAAYEQKRNRIISKYFKKSPFFERGKRISKCDSIELAGSASFSEWFNLAIGTNNTINTYGPDNDNFRVRLFAAFAESEALRQHHREDNQHLQILLECLNEQFKGNLDMSNGLQWNFFFGGKIAEDAGYVKLIQVFFNCSRNDAIWTLAYMVGIDFEKMFTTYATHLMAENDVRPVRDETVPQNLFEIVDGKYKLFAKLTDLHLHQGNSFQTIGAITTYQRGETTFCLPATVGRRELSIGRYQSGTFLLNQHLFYDIRDAS